MSELMQLDAISDDVDDDEEGINIESRSKKRKASQECINDDLVAKRVENIVESDTALDSLEALYKSPLVGYHHDTDLNIIYLRCPVGVVNYRQGIHACRLDGKVSVSSFKSLGYCDRTDTSLIECGLYTGRTHQLRLHLDFLGHPIANDPCYGGQLFYNQSDRRDRAVDLIKDMRRKGYHPLSKPPHLGADIEELLGEAGNEDVKSIPQSSYVADTKQLDNESDDDYLARSCRYCCDQSNLELESLLHCNGIWLHALRYERPGHWKFETSWPAWAREFNQD